MTHWRVLWLYSVEVHVEWDVVCPLSKYYCLVFPCKLVDVVLGFGAVHIFEHSSACCSHCPSIHPFLFRICSYYLLGSM